MAELQTLARPYAKAAFNFAKNEQRVDQWQEMLDQAAHLTFDDKVDELIHTPSCTDEAKAEAFTSLLGDTLDEKAKNFLRTVADYKRLSLLPYIAEQFSDLKAQEEHSIDVDVESAFELTKEQKSTLSNSLEARFNRKVRLKSTTNDDLIGGVIIRAGDRVIDGSVRGKLQKLTEVLSS